MTAIAEAEIEGSCWLEAVIVTLVFSVTLGASKFPPPSIVPTV